MLIISFLYLLDKVFFQSEFSMLLINRCLVINYVNKISNSNSHYFAMCSLY